jgi:hypothetical protein
VLQFIQYPAHRSVGEAMVAVAGIHEQIEPARAKRFDTVSHDILVRFPFRARETAAIELIDDLYPTVS